jgi:hypothetical protein
MVQLHQLQVTCTVSTFNLQQARPIPAKCIEKNAEDEFSFAFSPIEEIQQVQVCMESVAQQRLLHLSSNCHSAQNIFRHRVNLV